MSSIGEELPKEQARVRGLLGAYHAIGPAGAIGVRVLEARLRRADQAVMSGDVVEMIRAYEELKACE